MKKFILTSTVLLTSLMNVSGQTVIKNNYDSPITTADGRTPTETTNANGFVQGSDIGLTFNTDQKVYGLNFLYDVSDLVYSGFGFTGGFGDYSSYQCNFYLGIGKRYLIGSSVLLQGKIGGYAGYLSYDQATFDKKGHESKETKGEFAYGAEANIAAGLKLWTSSKGTSGFITLGYYMTAPKFKTENMGDNGSWCIGITLIK